MKTSGKMHYAWWIFIACCFISAGGFALVFDIVGIYLDTVSESLSIDMGALTLWLGIESLVEFFVMPFAGKLFTTKRINLFIALAALLVAGGTLGFSLCTDVLLYTSDQAHARVVTMPSCSTLQFSLI